MPHAEKRLSMRFVNLEMMRHLVESIRHLGNLVYQSSRLGEAMHRRCKNVGQRTNKKFIERDILVKVKPHTYLSARICNCVGQFHGSLMCFMCAFSFH